MLIAGPNSYLGSKLPSVLILYFVISELFFLSAFCLDIFFSLYYFMRWIASLWPWNLGKFHLYRRFSVQFQHSSLMHFTDSLIIMKLVYHQFMIYFVLEKGGIFSFPLTLLLHLPFLCYAVIFSIVQWTWVFIHCFFLSFLLTSLIRWLCFLKCSWNW